MYNNNLYGGLVNRGDEGCCQNYGTFILGYTINTISTIVKLFVKENRGGWVFDELLLEGNEIFHWNFIWSLSNI